MDLKQIERLMLAMQRHGMKRVVIREKGLELELEKEGIVPALPAGGFGPIEMPRALPSATMERRDEPRIPHPPKEEEGEAEGQCIRSPMVGTFYSAASPEHAPFVKVGDQIEVGQVVCIIEAMKVMNEVRAGLQGKIVEIFVKNGEPVEFGTKLYRVV